MAGASSTTFLSTKRYAVVTGGNKGIGLEICKQLASSGVVVLLTARDAIRGLDAVRKLTASGLSVLFHQLDVADPASVAAAADFVTTHFGKLDILVNNAAVAGVNFISEAFIKATEVVGGWGPLVDWNELATQDYEMAIDCLNINFYGTKRTTEAFIPLLQLSDSPRIINISSAAGRLATAGIRNRWAIGLLSDPENLTEEKVEQVLVKFLQDFKDGSLEPNGWPLEISAYRLSKIAVNAYTRILARTYPSMLVSCVCPGFVKTDMVLNTGKLTPEVGAAGPVRLALMSSDVPSGLFYIEGKLSPF